MASLSIGYLEAGLLYPREWCRKKTATTYTCMVLGFRDWLRRAANSCNCLFHARDWDQLEGVA